MELPPHLKSLASDVEQLQSLADFCGQQGWSPAGSGLISLVIDRSPFRMLTTKRQSAKLRPDDLLLTEAHADPAHADPAQASTGDRTALHRLHQWIAQRFNADVILQTHSVWSALLADRFGPLDGVLLEGFELLQRLSGVQSSAHVEWLPIAMLYDRSSLIQAVERTLQDTPSEISLPVRAMVVQHHGLLTWASSCEEVQKQAELFEYFCEYLIRRASLG